MHFAWRIVPPFVLERLVGHLRGRPLELQQRIHRGRVFQHREPHAQGLMVLPDVHKHSRRDWV